MRRRSRSTSYGHDPPDTLPLYRRYHRLMLKQFGHMSKTIRYFFLVALCLSMVLYMWVAFIIVSNPFSNTAFTELDKCPACYGIRMCQDFSEGRATLSGLSRLKFLHFLFTRNVFYGYHDENEVVFKRLGQISELQALDDRICAKAGLPLDCDIKAAMAKIGGQSGTKWLLPRLKGQTDMMMCPSDRLLDMVLHYYSENTDAVELSAREKMQLTTTLLLSADTVMKQTFPQSLGYPFPKYYGACGRMVVEEYVGKSLDHFFQEKWETRVRLAYQVLKIAERFTENRSKFALYWTDLSYEHLAVDSRGVVKVIDASRIMVVDRWQIQKDAKPGWNETYSVDFDLCRDSHPTCIPETSDLLCKHHITDHNFYMVCNRLLSGYSVFEDKVGGLLHSIPLAVDINMDVGYWVEECANPSSTGGRMVAKAKLLDILKSLTVPEGLL